MLKLLHFVFWYVVAHLALFGILFLVAAIVRQRKRDNGALIRLA